MKLEEIKELNIYEKMSLITNEIGTVAKNLKVEINEKNSYKAVSERDILDAVKPLESKYRIYSYPYERKVIDNGVLTKEGKYGTTNSLYLRIETVYRFVNIDKPEEFIDIKCYGDGIDTGDKAPGKATTYSDKYGIMKGYKISTGDDPDKEASAEEGYIKIDYKTALLNKIKDLGLDINEYAKEHKLSVRTTQQQAKAMLEELNAN